ncbi:MAG: methionyl-tRNA formyltransferase [Pyrinomonadaceae bacterium]|nr:methionyl-tRNA formyltransferase [Phycisphaerales bacterium]
MRKHHAMNIIFFGSGEFGLPTLLRLAAEHRVVAVVSQPDRPSGRGGVLTPTPISLWAAQHLPSVPLIRPERVSEPGVLEQIRSIAGEHQAVFVVIAFGQKMPSSLLDGIFAINLHASLLPRWRGAAPINAAILAGDHVTGNSVITLADRMDAGRILGQTKQNISDEMTAGELHDILSKSGPDLVMEVLGKHAGRTLEPTLQDESLVTKAAKLSRKDGVLDFTLDAELCRRKIHGLTPWPGVTVWLSGEAIKLLRVSVAGIAQRPPPGVPFGTLMDSESGIALCGNGTLLQIHELQPAGKRPMTWQAFARGRQLAAGAIFRAVA